MDLRIINEAIEKLNNERKIAAKDNKAKAVAGATADALINFCGQSDVFARAVVEGGSFEECCKKIVEKCGNAISDFEVFSRAVRHYLPTATVEFQMRIVTPSETPAADTRPAADNIINLSLADFL